ncbi:dTDP-4-dehydrorhamnose 3,5-epimerase family protein [Fundidesulfovibrio soli]|uniref:dTDP-4-dehydrorhamnose 3,5-epimerase family protein n=1 Tax=Fundidesulfovibrio soli TaxID=2922716 RepID=UPI001FAFB6D7|nr:dTDP-4-dehydrorhamnose 3,5-epimerase family protein [Fundidesulfovibrio soli]
MTIIPTPVDGLFEVSHTRFTDSRGLFERLFCIEALVSILKGRHIVAVNHSKTASIGALRGLHYQMPPHAEMKLVCCLRGSVHDVAVDIRQGSSTFLRHHTTILTGDNARMVVIPEGFAHGFQVLEPDSELLYLHTAPYAPASERGLAWNDPRLAIEWPGPVTDISQRDGGHAFINDSFQGVPA